MRTLASSSTRKGTIPLRRQLLVFIQLAVVWAAYIVLIVFAADEVVTQGSGVIFGLIGAGFAPLVITVFIRTAHREHVIEEYGLDSRAKILRATASESPRSGYHVEFVLEIHPTGGTPVQVRTSETVLPAVLSKYKAGSTIMVRWHPAYPEKVSMKIDRSFAIGETGTP